MANFERLKMPSSHVDTGLQKEHALLQEQPVHSRGMTKVQLCKRPEQETFVW